MYDHENGRQHSAAMPNEGGNMDNQNMNQLNGVPNMDSAPNSYEAQNTYSAQNPYAMPNPNSTPNAYNAQSTYNTPNAYNAQNTYGAQSTYNAPNAYNMQNPYDAQNTYAGQNMNTANYNYGNPYQGNAQAPVVCPGKEITSMVFGINALVWGIFSAFFCWHIICAAIYGLMSIGCGIVALVLHKKVLEEATFTTKKVALGKKLGIAGIICSAIAIVLSIIVLMAIIALGVGSALYGLN